MTVSSVRLFAVRVLIGLGSWAEAVALVTWWPDPVRTGRHLSHPYRWLAAAGADQAGAELARLGLWLCVLWAAVAVLATVARGIPGRVGRLAQIASRAMMPRAVRTFLVGSIGLSVALLPALAHAAPGGGQAGPAVAMGAGATLAAGERADVGWSTSDVSTATPRRPAAAPPPNSTAAASASYRAASGRPLDVPWPGRRHRHRPAVHTGPVPVVVVPGDCLWLIAAHRLGADADAASVAAEWPRWYRTNARVIGTDPSMLRPGQALRVPAGAGGRT